jgi:hypothetical protein
MKRKCVSSVAWFAVIVLLAAGPAASQNDGKKPRFVHQPDLAKLLPKFLTPQGFLDQRFAEAVAKPSPYYSDFYGIQALKDTTKEFIKRDFVPKIAEVVTEDESTITLKFKTGFSGKFYTYSALKVMGIAVDLDHVEISGETWQDLLKNLDVFRNILKTNKFEKKYLIPNPFYKDELVVANQMAANKPTLVVPTTTLEEFAKERDAILIYPEGVHGNINGYQTFRSEVLDKQKFSWIGMEMLIDKMQKDLDVFVKAPENSPEYLRTRKVLLEYFKDAWNGRAGPKTSAEENYYFKIVDQVKANKTRIIALEDSFAEYILFRYGENKFGGAVRSYRWANRLPKTGRGLVFGGSGHFTEPGGLSFQNFQQLLNPKMKMFVLAPLKIRKPVT